MSELKAEAVEHEELDEEMKRALVTLKSYAKLLALVEDDPEEIGEKLAGEFARRWPDRVGRGWWIDLEEGEVDKGLTLRFFRHRKLSLDGLVGADTAGVAAFYDLFKKGKGDTRVTVSLGAGATSPYGSFGDDWSPVISLKVGF